jgi:predicted RNase H-like HicB family nuclease
MAKIPAKKKISAPHIRLTAQVWKDNGKYVAYAPELDVSSFGDSLAHAKERLREALTLFFEGASRLGTLEDILSEAVSRDTETPTVLAACWRGNESASRCPELRRRRVMPRIPLCPIAPYRKEKYTLLPGHTPLNVYRIGVVRTTCDELRLNDNDDRLFLAAEVAGGGSGSTFFTV